MHDEMSEGPSAVTRVELDAMECLRIGGRDYLLRRVITALDGHCGERDELPARLREPIQDGGACHGVPIRQKDLAEAIDSYYELRGMDRYSPTDARLERLGLHEVSGLIPRHSEGSHCHDL